jgi:GAF domain-containing protein/CheY-like chemotaxis protein
VAELERQLVAQRHAADDSTALAEAGLQVAERQRREAGELARAASMFAASLDVAEVGQRVVESLLPLFDVRSSSLRLLQPNGAVLAIAWGGRARDFGFQPGYVVPAGHGVVGRAIGEGRACWTADLLAEPWVQLDAETRARVEASGDRAFLAVPLRAKDEIIGVLTLADPPGRRFTESEVGLAQGFADLAAVAVDNARHYETARRRQHEAEELARVAATLSASLDVAEVCGRIAQTVLTIFHARGSTLWLIRPDGQLALVAIAGDARAEVAPGEVSPAGHGVAGWAIAVGGPVWTPDALAEPQLVFTEAQRGRILASERRAALATPLRGKGGIIGVLRLSDTTGRIFDEADAVLLGAFGSQAALALDNARLFEDRERRRREAVVGADLARSISSSLDLHTVLERVTDGARDLCGADVAGIALRDPGEAAAVIRHVAGMRMPEGTVLRIEPGRGLGGQVLATGAPARTDDYLADPRISQDYGSVVRAVGTVAQLAVPIQGEREVDGYLMVGRRAGRPFTDRDETTLVQLAAHASIAIQNSRRFAAEQALAQENARLYQETEIRAGRLRTLTRLNALVSSSLDMPAVLGEIARAAAELMRAPMVAFWLADEAAQVLDVGATFADDTVLVEFPVRRMAFGENAVGWVAVHRQALNVPDTSSDPRVTAQDWLRANALSSFLAVPAVLEGRLLAVLAMLGRRPFELGPESHDLLEAFVAQAAQAIRNARLYAGSEARRRAAEALAQVGRALTEALDVKLVARRIASSLCELFAAQAAAVYRLEPSGDLVAMASAGEEESMSPALLPRGTGISSIAVRERRPSVTTDLLRDPRLAFTPEIRAHLARSRARAALAVPLIVQDRVLGAIAVRAAESFDEGALELAGAFADQAAVALENARLYQEARDAYDELARTQEQLVQSQKMDAIGQLAGGVAHDFNNLLTVITGRSELSLQSLAPDDPRREHVELIAETAERAAALTRQLLAFSRRQILQPKLFDLNRVVGDMSRMLRRLIGEDIEMRLVLDRDLWRVRADPGQIEQVILNLAVNARDAMPRGGRLVIETRNVALGEVDAGRHGRLSPGSYVQITVSDVGVGMDLTTQSRIFEPFFTTKGPAKGTGLGLATVYGIVQQSGGHVAVESRPGRGATFRIWLPSTPDGAEAAEDDAPTGAHHRGWETILLVEDDADVRAVARVMLEGVGYVVLPVGSPGEALTLAEQHADPIHLLLTDVIMPEMSGRELAQHMVERRPDIRVLYMSGYTADAMLVHGMLDPEVTLIEKPFTLAGLRGKVRERLDAAP